MQDWGYSSESVLVGCAPAPSPLPIDRGERRAGRTGSKCVRGGGVACSRPERERERETKEREIEREREREMTYIIFTCIYI